MKKSTLFRNLRILGLSALLASIAGNHAQAESLIQNGTFDSGLQKWHINSDLEGWSPWQTNGTVSIHPDVGNFFGNIIWQPVNVTGIANKVVAVGVRVNKTYAPPEGSTVTVTINYVTDSNEEGHALAIAVPNSTVTNSPDWNWATGEMTIASHVRKLTRIGINKAYYGELYVDEITVSATNASAGPVPEIAGLATSAGAAWGPYGTTVTLTGTNFGTAQGGISFGEDTNGVAVASWSNTIVRATVNPPAHGGRIFAWQDHTASYGHFDFNSTSPHCTLALSDDDPLVQRGAPVSVTCVVDYHNGFNPSSGVVLSVPGAPQDAVKFQPTTLKSAGGSQLTVETAGLTNGIYRWSVQALAPGSFTSSVPFEVEVADATTVAYTVMGAPVTAPVPVTNQGLVALSFLPTTAKGDILPTTSFRPISSDSNVVDVLWNPNYGGLYEFYAVGSGTALVSVVNPLNSVVGTSVTVHVDIRDAVVVTGMTLEPAAVHNGGQWYGFNAHANGNIGWNIVGALGTESLTWDTYNSGQSVWLTNRATTTTAPGRYLIGALNKRYLQLTVTNDPASGAVSGNVVSLSGEGMHGASGYLILALATNENVRTTNSVWSMTSAYSAGNIPPGIYRARYEDYSGNGQWYPNADSFSSASNIVVTAGNNTGGVNFFIGDAIPTVSVKGNISYSGTQDGWIIVQAFDSTGTNLVASTVVPSPGIYTFASLTKGATYHIKAFLDDDWSTVYGPKEAAGSYAGNPLTPNWDIYGADIVLSDPYSGPKWWATYGVIASNATANDYAAANHGQLKWLAVRAYAAMTNSTGLNRADDQPINGFTNVAGIVASLAPSNNFATLTLGQAKRAAAPYYNWLTTDGSWTNGYPWANKSATNDFAAINVGQLKHLFSFEIPQ